MKHLLSKEPLNNENTHIKRHTALKQPCVKVKSVFKNKLYYQTTCAE